jgi:hypothetical protein
MHVQYLGVDLTRLDCLELDLSLLHRKNAEAVSFKKHGFMGLGPLRIDALKRASTEARIKHEKLSLLW